MPLRGADAGLPARPEPNVLRHVARPKRPVRPTFFLEASQEASDPWAAASSWLSVNRAGGQSRAVSARRGTAVASHVH